MKKLVCALLCALLLLSVDSYAGRPVRLVYWNIQNGMWDGQTDDYQRFTDWVKAQKPDVCVWCESQPIYKTGTYTKLDNINEWRADSLMTVHWKRLGRRYGHKYVYISGHRDNYPQVVTSRFPLESVDRMVGNADTLVAHGAGWVRLKIAGKQLNLVTLHTWPHGYGYNVPKEDRERSREAHEGDKFRRVEMEYICRHTIGSVPGAAEEYWMMMGDFNSLSRADNWVYRFEDDDTRLLVHDYIRECTPYIDIVNVREPMSFYSSTGGHARIDFVYCTKPLADAVVDAHIHTDSYTRPVKSKVVTSFYEPSDHRPIIVDFDLK
ncbi:MAG: endonuclease/exonuclease/phosphatase family protein [Bacteroidales bacterium]|nr:endonuclease/exonuclease/phosphatase family protein [Bacteroidales bacterium]